MNSNPTPQAGPPGKDPEALRKLLATLWERSVPLVIERLDTLGTLAAAAQTGSLSAEQRRQTIDLAHKLAGSLGMFGYTEATGFAREIEQHLEAAGPLNALQFAEDVAALRASLPLREANPGAARTGLGG